MPSIDNISDETLLLIFILNSKQNLKPIHDPLKTTLVTSHVCKRSREIMLKHPILWTNSFDISRPLPFLRNIIYPRTKGHKIEALVIPSITPLLMQNARLRGAIEMYPYKEFPTVNTLFNNPIKLTQFSNRLLHILKLLPQTGKITLKIPYYGWLQLEMFFEFSISHLDTLALMRDKVDLHADFNTCTIITLSNVLRKAQSVWKMRTLQFEGCCVELNSVAFAGVENLYVGQLPTCIALSSTALVQVFKAMPKLKRVRIIDATMTVRYPNLAVKEFKYLAQPVKLPNLVQFVLWGQVLPVGEVMCSLEIPPECAISVHGKGMTSHQGPNPPILLMLQPLRVIFEKKQPPLSTHWNTVVIQMQSTMCRVRVWQQAFPLNPHFAIQDVGASASQPPTGLELIFFWNEALLNSSIPGGEPRIETTAVFLQVFSSMPKSCEGIIALHLEYDLTSRIVPAFHEGLMTDFLSHFPKVQLLDKITTHTVEFLVPYFICPFDGVTTTMLDPLKSLHTLCFTSVDFTKVYESLPNVGREPSSMELRQILLDFVERRSMNQEVSLIREVIFRQCTGFTDVDAETLWSFGTIVAFYH